MKLEKVTTIEQMRDMAPSLTKAQFVRPWNEAERAAAHKDLIKSINHSLDKIRESAIGQVKERIGKLQNTIELAPAPTAIVTPTTQSLAAKFINELAVEIGFISKFLERKDKESMEKIRYELRGAFEV